MQTLILVRGLPGSGKSTIAHILAAGFTSECTHIETDMYFLDRNGQYMFDKSQLATNHHKCQNKTRGLLAKGESVVVSNTFIKLWEIHPYFEMAKELSVPVQVIECKGIFGSTHNVTEEAVKLMQNLWEPLYSEKKGK
jgi:predicted kinase